VVIPIKTRCILVIDDQPEILNYIELNRLKEGFEILKAETGEKGVDLAVNNQVDLVLTDLRLPDLDGVEVMRQIHTQIPQLPTIIMSVDRMQDLSSIDHLLNSSEQGFFDHSAGNLKITRYIRPEVLNRP
jgi:DNA-binding response OmpR family regulator